MSTGLHDPMAPVMADVQKLPLRERDAARAAWLRAHGISYEGGAAGIKRAWDKERDKRRSHALRERERATHVAQDAGGTHGPLPSSLARMARKSPDEHAVYVLARLMGDAYCPPQRRPWRRQQKPYARQALPREAVSLSLPRDTGSDADPDGSIVDSRAR